MDSATDSKPGPSWPDNDPTKCTKQESESCLLAKFILFSDGTLVPIGVCSGKPP